MTMPAETSLASNESTACSNAPAVFRGKLRAIFFAAIIGAVLLLSVTSRSFWIDEAWTAHIARQPALANWWHELREEKVSDIQTPLYCLWIWGCEKIFGSSESSLRAVNFLWFVPTLLLLLRATRRNKSLQTALFLTVALSPFAWYYLNEARSYTMQVSTSLFVFAVLYHWHVEHDSAQDQRWWVLGFAAGLILLCGSSLLSMIFAAIPILAALVLLPWKFISRLIREFRFIWLATLGILFFIGLYYLWTLKIGARATSIATTDWRNPFFISYEILGFSGLGPGRLDIRQGGMSGFNAHSIELGIYAIFIGIITVFAMFNLIRQLGWKKISALLLALAAPIAFVLIVGVVLRFRVLGRHLAATAPIAFFLIAVGVASLWQRGRTGKILTFLFFGLYIASTLSLRFNSRHLKDDYRTAAQFARAGLENGEKVWWNADIMAAEYYNVPLSETESPGRAFLIQNPEPAWLVAAPDLVIASKPDIYDSQNLLPQFLTRAGFSIETNFPAFTIWKRTAQSQPALRD